MKRILFVFACLLLNFGLRAQGTLDFSLEVTDTKLKPLSGLKIEFIEAQTKQKIVEYTDASGKVSVHLETGTGWWLTVGKMYKYKYIEMPKGRGTSGELITYDVERWKRDTRPLPDRTKLNLTVEKTTAKKTSKPDASHTILILELEMVDKSPLKYYDVNLVDLTDKKIIEAKTDASGKAYFSLDLDRIYEIDLDGIESYKNIEIKNRPALTTYTITYQPAEFTQTETNNFITQKLPADVQSSSSHILYEINVKNPNGTPCAGETVSLDIIHSQKTYEATTDDSGQALFMLPIRRQYMLNFEFMKDVDVINLTHVKGVGHGSMSIVYKPNPRLQFPEEFIPTTEELVITEFNKFLQKQYPQPEKDKPLRMVLKWGNEMVNGQSKQAVLEIGFAATTDVDYDKSPPINIAFVMDKSGSMAGSDRIDELKISLNAFVESLRPQDRAALIAFDEEPELIIESKKMAGQKPAFTEAVNRIEAGGMTNIYKGMILGYEKIETNLLPDGTNRLILLTDGYGVTEPAVMVAKTKEFNDKGIALSAIGVGEDYNQALLKLMTEASGGLFQHVANSYDLQETFKQELSSVLYPVAKNVTVEIEYNDKIVFKQLYGFPFTNNESTHKATMKLVNVYPGLNDLALVKFDLDKPTSAIEKKPVIVRMTYFNLKTGKNETEEEKAYLKWDEGKMKYELITEAEQKQLYAIAIMNQSLKRMADAFSEDKYLEAQAAVNRAIEQIEELYPKAKQEDVEKLYNQLKEYSDILTQYAKNKIKKRASN